MSHRMSTGTAWELARIFEGFPSSLPLTLRDGKLSVDRGTRSLIEAGQDRAKYEQLRDELRDQAPLPDMKRLPAIQPGKTRLGPFKVVKRLGGESTQGTVFLLKEMEKLGCEVALKISPLVPTGTYELFLILGTFQTPGTKMPESKWVRAALRALKVPRTLLDQFPEGPGLASPEALVQARRHLALTIRSSWFDLETEPCIEALAAFACSRMAEEKLSFFFARLIACFRGFENRELRITGTSGRKARLSAAMEPFVELEPVKKLGKTQDVPVQCLVLEKLDGFLVHLSEDYFGWGTRFRWDRLASLLALLTVGFAQGQEHAGLVLNDAHWGNVGYFRVPSDSLVRVTLKGSGRVMEIPTYGLLPCCIDGGRASVRMFGHAVCFSSGFLNSSDIPDLVMDNPHADMVRTSWEVTRLLRDRKAFDWVQQGPSKLVKVACGSKGSLAMRSYSGTPEEHRRILSKDPKADLCIGLVQAWRTVKVPDNYELLLGPEARMSAHSEVERYGMRKALFGKEDRTPGPQRLSGPQGLEQGPYPLDLEDYRCSLSEEQWQFMARTGELRTCNDRAALDQKASDCQYKAQCDAYIFSTVDRRARFLSFEAKPSDYLEQLAAKFPPRDQAPSGPVYQYSL